MKPNDSKFDPMALPSLRARMGQWWYYLSTLKMSEIKARVSVAEEIHSGATLQELLQRKLRDRASEIADYLIEQDQRFFNSLVLGTYGGDPKWYEVSIKTSPIDGETEFPMESQGILGVLVLDGNETLFAIDGQHRVAGIRQALDKNELLRDEEVPIIMVAGVTQTHRHGDPEGFERTRRLFSTLNRHAKAVSKTDIIALDEDDAIAIVTRRLVEEYPLFRGKVSLGQGISIPPSDRRSFTSIVTLYDTLDTYLQEGSKRSWNRFKRFRPDEETLQSIFDRSKIFWDTYCNVFPELATFSVAPPKEMIAANHRHVDGGHLLFRPVGLQTSAHVVRDLMESLRLSLEEAVRRVSLIPMDLKHDMWRGLYWNDQNRRMITAPENKRAARRLMFHSLGGDLAYLKSTPPELRLELAGLLNKDEAAVSIERMI